MIYRKKPGQVSYGEAIGILLLDSEAPFIPGDVANATTYKFPVRFQRVPGLTVQRILSHDLSALEDVLMAARELKREGVRAITSDCGFMALYQAALRKELELPVFLSSLLQVPFLIHLIPDHHKIGILTVDSNALTPEVLDLCGANISERIAVQGLQQAPGFSSAFIEENGLLDFHQVEKEVTAAARQLVADNPAVRLILLECSVLPPYAPAVHQAVGLPVFDFVTMIRYVYSAVVREAGGRFL